MAENLIYVPESNEEKAKKILSERVALALNIASDGWDTFISERYGRIGLPDSELFAQIFNSVFQQLC